MPEIETPKVVDKHYFIEVSLRNEDDWFRYKVQTWDTPKPAAAWAKFDINKKYRWRIVERIIVDKVIAEGF